jgi:nucleoside-diphosphate-sugar epimerase
MKVSVIGHSGYIGQNIKFALQSVELEKLYLIGRNSTLEERALMIRDSDVVIHCAALQRTAQNNIQSFYPNFELTKNIVDNLSVESNLIFVSSIHYRSDTPFSHVRRMEENYIIKNSHKHTIYHLPYTFGPFGKPNYNNVFNTFLYNFANALPVTLNSLDSTFEVLSILEFSADVVNKIDENLRFVDNFNTTLLSLPEFVYEVYKVVKQNKVNSKFERDLKHSFSLYINK